MNRYMNIHFEGPRSLAFDLVSFEYVVFEKQAGFSQEIARALHICPRIKSRFSDAAALVESVNASRRIRNVLCRNQQNEPLDAAPAAN